MSEHTPGPWIAVRGLAYWEVKPEQKDGGHKLPFQIADTCSSDPEDPDRGLQEANAHLIAAAPELLTGLEDAVLFLLGVGVSVESPIMERLALVIRKAKGLEQ